MDKEEFCALLIMLAILATLIGGAMWLKKSQCDARTQGIGFAHSWGPLQGCLVEHQPGVWIPLENYRVF